MRNYYLHLPSLLLLLFLLLRYYYYYSAADNQNNRAFCGTSMKCGTLLANGNPKGFEYGATINFQHGAC